MEKEIKLLVSMDNKLKEKSTEVIDFDNSFYLDSLEKIKEVCLEQHAYAAAAPQFGIFKRFILIMTPEEMKAKTEEELESKEINYVITPYFNPKIVSMSGKQYFYEACMSVDNTIGKVARPYSIKLEAQDIDGNYIYKEVNGFEAIIFCHEIDHLDGIEYIDKAEEIFYNVSRTDRLQIREKYPHEIISKEGFFNQDNIKEKFKTVIYNESIN